MKANLSPAKDWSAARDLPDPVALKDLRQWPHLTMPIVRFGGSPEVCRHLPWPNGDKLRSLALLDPFDEMAVRVGVATMIRQVDAHLPARPTVVGYRLGRRPPGWAYQHSRLAFEGRRSRLLALFREPRFRGLLLTDVRRCYPSMQAAVVFERMGAVVGDLPELDAIESWLRIWQVRDGLEGLPIGPEWSPVFAHAVLGVVDHALVATGADHVRWSDDIAVVLRAGDHWEAVCGAVDAALRSVNLERSLEKTDWIDDPERAVAAIVDRELSGLGFALRRGSKQAARWNRGVFDETAAAGKPNVHRFRYSVRTMQHRRDPYGAQRFLGEPGLMEIDPNTVGTYLAALVHKHPDDVAALFDLLAAPPTVRTAAVQVHLLRAATHGVWGAAEGRLFSRAARDGDRGDVVQWWAAEARAVTPESSRDAAIAEVESANDRCARRRYALPLRRLSDSRQRSVAATHVARLDADLSPTAALIERGAA